LDYFSGISRNTMPIPADTVSLAMTGASGAPYGLRLLESLLKAGKQVYLMVSAPAQVVLATETELQVPGRPEAMQAFFTEHFGAEPGQLLVFGREQWMAPVASGSNAPQSMVICPCSTSTLSSVAAGASNTLIERAADVMLKERRQLIMVVREMPLSAIHLEHMLKLAQLGVTIMPASPGFYHQPRSVDDMVDFVVARVLDHLGIEQQLAPRWGET
jgi:4-hydroxy-3-polyprenylbenzoate decarboxylase